METQKRKSEKARFDTKLTKTQKDLFERAANLGGFRSLTDFIIKTTEEKAKSIIQEHDVILASDEDRRIFFNELMNPRPPSKKLIEAAKAYKEMLEK
jgi:uncharacterized protein (DUF1778 family)